MADQTKYKSSPDFQTKILALMVQEPNFIGIYYDVLNPDFFTYDMAGILARLILKYYQDYNISPTAEALADLTDAYINRYSVIQEDRDRLLNAVDYIYRCSLEDGDYVKDKVVSFGRTVALKHAIGNLIDLVEDPDEDNYESVRDIIDRALITGTPMRRDRFDFNTFMRDPFGFFDSLDELNQGKLVGTPWPQMTSYLEGGLGPGHLGVVMAGPGIGKSLWLLNIAHYAVEVLRRPTYYFAIGDLKEYDVATRYLCLLFNMTFTELRSRSNEDRIQQCISRHASWDRPLEIAYFSPQMATVSTLKSYITKRKALNPEMRPGLIIVDYADNISPTRHAGNGTYLEMGGIYEKLIEMGDMFECPTWTATQPRRWSLSTELLDVEQVGDSWKKIQHADVVVTLNKSRDEHNNHMMKAHVAKSRRGKSKDVDVFRVDFSRMAFMEIGFIEDDNSNHTIMER